jgi:DNA ligase-1
MLKRKASTYEVGRRHGSWWKWSAESLLLKVVLVYAECSERPGSNLYRDFTFAVWSGDELVPVAKASEGLSEDQVIEIDAFIRNNTVEKFGPVRGVTPQLVFEIAFEGINPSPRRKSGVALHAPRIKTWHRTMTARDANTREDLHRFLVRQPGLKLLPEE